MFPLLLPLVASLVLINLRSIRLIDALIALILLLAPVCIHIYFKQEQSTEIFHHSILSEWNLLNFFKKEFFIEEGQLSYALPNIVAALTFLVHPGLVSAGIVFLIFWIFTRNKKPSFTFPVILCGMIFYILFIAGMNYQNERYLVALVPFYLVMCFPVYLSIVAHFYGRKKILFAMGFLVLAVQIGLTARAFAPFLRMNRLEHKIAEAVLKVNPPSVYTFGAEGTLVNRGYKGSVVSLFETKLDTLDQNALLLFNLKNTEQQWTGKLPMNNYWYLVQNGNPRRIASIGDGWELYELTQKHSGTDTRIPGQ
jgi:hypothetical protein